ncbi:MAG: dihydroorotate dehydrogenase [Clostridiales bacterium]|nr:dihydroorotate dehydrogenase [Clostridiales bacterium]
MKLAVSIAGVELKNPIMPASGTFSAREFSKYIDVGRLGAIVTKGVAPVPWQGNPPPRCIETASGMLNAVGLQNPGVDSFIANDLPLLSVFKTRIIVNICGHSLGDYIDVTEKLREAPIDMLELNISCPNVAEGGMAFGTDRNMVERVVGEVKKRAAQPLIVKLSPNVTDICEIARAAESAGADALSLINTLLGMKIDIHKKRFALENKTGGLSGPAIKPIAVRMIYQVSRAVKLPLIGMGGVMTGEDAAELLMAGATAVAVGTASFHRLTALTDVLDELTAFLKNNNISDVNALREIII